MASTLSHSSSIVTRRDEDALVEGESEANGKYKGIVNNRSGEQEGFRTESKSRE